MEENNFNCPICLEIVEDAMECGECSNIFCKKCVKSLSSCSTCRKKIVFKESHFANKLIGNLPIECVNQCGKTMRRKEKHKHNETCPNRKYKCNTCSFRADKQLFLNHLLDSHTEQLIRNFSENEFSQPIECEEKECYVLDDIFD